MPFWPALGDVEPRLEGLLSIRDGHRSTLDALLRLGLGLVETNLSVSDLLERRSDVLDRGNRRLVDGVRLREQSVLNRSRLLKNGRPDVLGEMRDQRGSKQGGSLEVLHEDVVVHADIGRRLGVGTSGVVQLVETVLESFLVPSPTT